MLLLVPKQNENAIRWIANSSPSSASSSRCRCGSGIDRRAATSSSSSGRRGFRRSAPNTSSASTACSTLLILLTTMMGFIAVLSSWTAITERVKEYYIFLLVLQTGMLGAFMSLDFLLFFLFWEVMLVPMYFLIGIWGSANRLYSAIKFFLYTLVGSVVMLLGILALYFYNHSRHRRVHVRRHAVPQADGAVRPAVVGVPRVLPRLRDQGADVPVPHLAARRAHRRADRRLGDSGGRPPEDGHLRLPALQPADSARGDAPLRADDGRCSRSSASSTARWSRWRRRTGSGWSPTRRSATWRW